MAFSKLNYVNVGKGGTFHATGDVQSTPEDVDALIHHLRSEGKTHVVLHLHGGLVTEAKGMEIAQNMVPPYEEAGAHPVSIVYETGFLETLQRNLRSIHETKLFGKLVKYVRKLVAEKLGLGGLEAADEGLPNLDRPAKELESDGWFTSLEAAAAVGPPEGGLETVDASEPEDEAQIEAWIEADDEMRLIVEAERSQPVVRSDKVVGEEGLEGVFSWATLARSIYRIAKRVIRRLWRDRDHGAYCTIVEEIIREVYLADFGQRTWSAMKSRAHDMFQSNEGREGLEQLAARYLVDGLAKLQAEDPEFTVDVVGHSLGTVATCHLLNTMAGSLKVRRIAFLAPAVRTEIAHAALFTHPERFESFRLFTMTDAYETNDELLGVIYPRSLLYFISGALESSEVDETILGMERHLTGRPPYDETHLVEIVDYLKAEPSRAVWSVTDLAAPDGLRSTSEQHGAFDDDPKTRESLTHYLGTA